jgi:2-aminobenzoate-CoA ligase
MAITAHVDTFARDHLPPASQWPVFHFDRPEYQYPERSNAAAALLDGAIDRGWGGRTALRTTAGPGVIGCTYAQLAAQVNRIARVLVEDLGLVPGNRVLLRGPNTPMLAAIFLAVLRAGLVAVPTMPLLRARELKPVIDKAQVQAALVDARLRDDLLACQDRTSEHHCASLAQVLAYNDPAAAALDALAQAKPAEFAAVDTHRDDVALIAFTSGTTGQPKGTVHFHRDLLVMSDAFPRHVLRPSPDDIFIGTPPLAFTFGLGGLLTMPLRCGASVVMNERYTPESLLATIAQTGASVLFTAPTMYRQLALLLQDRARGLAVPSLRKCVSAGEALPDATRQLWRAATGIEMIDGIGATEMIHIFIASAAPDVRPGAIGKVVPGYVARIVDENMQTLPPGTVGKLAVQGPSGCRYLADARQQSYVRDGWNLPGDTFTMDADGYFFYQARSDDMIVSAGYNIAGPEVEAALLLHPAVAECGVVGAPDDERGQIVKAYVVLKDSAQARADDALKRALQEFVKQQIAPYKYPRSVEFVDKLPRTETGKLQRFRLREMARAAAGAANGGA